MAKFNYKGYFENPQEQALVDAMVANDFDKITHLVAEGVSLDCVGKFETTPIRITIVHKNPELLTHILKLGANPNFKTSKNIVAAKFAVEHDDTTYTKILLKAGLDPNIYYDDRPIIFYPLESADWEQYDLLVEAGADTFKAKSGNNTTVAVALAILFEYERLKQHILDGGDITTPSNAGLSLVKLLARHQKRFGSEPKHPAYKARVELLNMLREREVELPLGIPGIEYPEFE